MKKFHVELSSDIELLGHDQGVELPKHTTHNLWDSLKVGRRRDESILNS